MSSFYTHPDETAIVSYDEMWMIQKVDQAGIYLISFAEDGGAADTGRALAYTSQAQRDCEFSRVIMTMPGPKYLHPNGGLVVRYDRIDMLQKKDQGSTYSIVFNGLDVTYTDQTERDDQFDGIESVMSELE